MTSLPTRPSPRAALRVAPLLVLLALAGCRQEKPPTVVPPGPSVDTFTASASTVEAGAAVTLAWKTSNATTVTLTDGSGAALPVPAAQLEGSTSVTVNQSALYVLTARGPGGADAKAVSVTVGAGPAPLTLVAVPAALEGGERTTLAWTAPGATAVTLTAGAELLDTRGQTTSGALVVQPTRDTTYTLTAGDRTATTAVTVAVALLGLEVTPRAAKPGDAVTLSWRSAGAERLTITSPGRGLLREVTAPADVVAGTFADVVPQLPPGGVVTWAVTAHQGSSTATRTVTVHVDTGLAIDRFDAPPVASAGVGYFVRWETTAADRVQLLVDGLVSYETTNAALVAQGLWTFTAPASDFEVQLVATNALGDRAVRVAQVDAVGVPTSATLTAAPGSVQVGDPVTLTFAAAEARRVRITDGDGLTVFTVTGQRAEAGTATVYPAASTTYTLSADNLLGSAPVTATATVTVAGTAPTAAQYPPTALPGQRVELRPTPAGSLLYGFPHLTVLESAASSFVDIAGTGQRVLEEGASVTSVTLPFATWLWGREQSGPLTISRAGWMAWGAPAVVNSSPASSLPSTSSSAAPGLIAPLWVNLVLDADSAVLVQLVGEAPEQRLVVQWNKVRLSSSSGAQLTFQAQVHQAGLVSFHYQEMTSSTTTHLVGLQDDTRTRAVRPPGSSSLPASNSAYYFFSPITVPAEAVAQANAGWSGFVKLGTGYALVKGAHRVVRVPQELTLSELMFRPSPAVPAGQYVEALSFLDAGIDLTGWFLRAGDGTSFAVPDGTVVPAGGTLVLGETTDRAQNDDAGVQVAWGGSGFSLGYDGGSVNLGTADAGYGLVFYPPSDGGTGASVEIDPGPFVFAGSSTPGFQSCWATTPYGGQAPAQRGSPGAVGTCGFGYLRTAITPRFRDISQTGTVLLAPTTANVLEQKFEVTLAAGAGDPAPLLFGSPRPLVTVSSCGWLVPGTTNPTTSGISSNKTSPTAAAPIGTIAPFWDDLESIANVSTLHWKAMAPNEDPLDPARHWIFQWSHVSTDSGSSGPDDLTFQVKLFEDGTVEFHYAAMTSGTSSEYGLGGSATVWLENPTGTQALSVSTNTQAPRSNTAWRFSVR